MNPKYLHTEEVHNFKSPNEIVPFIMEIFNPTSVIDVGCGIGTWLHQFKKNGVSIVLGIDGHYVNRVLLKIEEKEFLEKDLEQVLDLNETFDLVLSLEVAEHLSESVSDLFIENLCKLGDVILFSAAIPNQGGQNHINEQPPSYWIKKFRNCGFEMFDIMRPIFWDNENVDWWYKQNMLIFTKNNDFNFRLELLKSFEGAHLVHPIVLKNRSYESLKWNNEVNRIEFGLKSFKFYKSVLRKKFKISYLKIWCK